MAENIVYIPYGDTEINQNSFLESVANGEIDNYMNTRRWLSLGKHAQENRAKVLLAVLHILNSGVTGAHIVTPEEAAESNGTKNVGLWMIDHEKEIQVPEGLEDIYGEAAYIIQTLMSRAPKKKKEEKELKLFDNSAFQSGLTSYIGNHLYGGRKSSEWINEWTNQDELPKQGLRGTTNRQAAMAKQLAAYKQYVNNHANEYNFEGTPYNSLEEWNTRADRAIAALNNTEWNQEDRDSLNALGLNYNDWFNDSGEDSVSVQGVSMTRNQYLNEYLPALEELKKEQEKAAAIEKAKQLAALRANLYDGFRTFDFSKINGRPITNKEIENLPKLFAKDKFSGDEASLIVGVFKLAERNNQLVPLSKEEIQRLPSNLQGNRSKYLRKVNGLDGIYYDTLTKLYKKPYKNGISSQSFLDILALNSVEALKEKRNNTPRGNGELTQADYIDIGATLADLGALINPEIISGTILSMGAAAARTYNKDWTNGDFWDNIWKSAVDLGTGALGGTPLLGDASSLAKFAKGFGKLMTLPAVINAFNSTDEAKLAISKLKFDSIDNLVSSLKTLTPKDYHAISSVLTGIIGGRNYVRGNLAEREVLKRSGIETLAKTKRREYANRYGLLRTKPQNTKEVPTLKVTDANGKVEEIPITKEQKAILQKTKPSEIEAKVLELKIKVPEGYKVNANLSKINTIKTYLNSGNSNIISSKTLLTNRGEDKFNEWLDNRGLWSKWAYGSNSNLRRIRENLLGKDVDESGLISLASENSPNAKLPLEQGTIKYSDHIEGFPNKGNSRESSIRRSIMKRYLDVMSGKFSSKDMKTTSSKEGYKIGNETIRVHNTSDAKGNSFISIYTSKGTSTFKSQEEAKKFIANIVKEQKNNIVQGKITKENIKEIGKVLQDLKKKGWLKEGGRIDKLKIEMAKKYFKI